MADIFNDDFIDFLKSFNNNEVEYVLVGGYSVVLHGYSRTTGDMDVFVNRTEENYFKIKKAFYEFGMSMFDMSKDNFLSEKYDVFTFGRAPVAIDLMTKMKGVEFKEAFDFCSKIQIQNIDINLIHINQLIQAKKASNRPKDIDDVNNLSEQ